MPHLFLIREYMIQGTRFPLFTLHSRIIAACPELARPELVEEVEAEEGGNNRNAAPWAGLQGP
jgi:hypothetical protein